MFQNFHRSSINWYVCRPWRQSDRFVDPPPDLEFTVVAPSIFCFPRSRSLAATFFGPKIQYKVRGSRGSITSASCKFNFNWTMNPLCDFRFLQTQRKKCSLVEFVADILNITRYYMFYIYLSDFYIYLCKERLKT